MHGAEKHVFPSLGLGCRDSVSGFVCRVGGRGMTWCMPLRRTSFPPVSGPEYSTWITAPPCVAVWGLGCGVWGVRCGILGLEFGVWGSGLGLGFRVWGFRVQGLGLGVGSWGVGCRVSGVGLSVEGLGFGFWDFGFWV